MELRVQILAIAISATLFGFVFELVRRRRLMERYALLWLLATAVLLVLSVWSNLLNIIATSVGILYGPSLLFAIAFAFVIVLLLHFSLAISRLSDQNKVLAQRIGMLQQQLDAGDGKQVTLPRVAEPAPAVGADELQISRSSR